MSDIWDMISAISTAFSAVVIFVAAIIAVWQLCEMRKARQLDAFINLIQILQDEKIREARGILLEKLSKKEFKEWTDDERKQADKACQAYDIVGMMSSKKHIDSKLAAEWHNSIIKCWKAAEPMIMQYRKKRGKDFWHDFETLYEIARKYEETRKAK
jgi:hypothetical protein